MFSVLNGLTSSSNLGLLLRTFSKSLGLSQGMGVFLVLFGWFGFGFCGLGVFVVFFCLFFILLFLLSELIFDC